MSKVEQAVQDLNGEWPYGVSGHYIAIGDALYDRRHPMDSAFICSKSEFEEGCEELESFAEYQADLNKRFERLEKAAQWARDHGADVPEGFVLKSYDLAILSPIGGTATLEFLNPYDWSRVTFNIDFEDGVPEFARA